MLKKRILLLFLTVILLLSPFLVSCKKNSSNPTGTAQNTESGGVLPYLDTLPENKTGFTEIRALAFESNCIPDSLDENASAIDFALFERDSIVRERYGIHILYTPVTARFAVDMMRRSVISGDNTYNVFLYQAQELMSIATESCLQDLNNVANLDLSQQWWNQSLNSNLTINNKLFCTAGQYSQWYFGAPVCMAYNKSIAADNGITEIDSLVDSGGWTLEAMQKICREKNITADRDNNGVMDGNDTYMISAYQPALYGLFASTGGKFSTIDRNSGEISVNISDKASVQRLDKIIGVFNSTTTFYSNAIADSEKVFMSGRSLFFYAPLGFMADLLDVTFEYGILPTPKLDSTQNNYIACGNPQSNFCLGIPYGLSKEETDFVGLIMEAYNYVSSEIVKPVKYDSFMKYRVADDPASSARLDVMFENLYFDMNLVMDFGKSRTLINQTIFNETTNRYASSVKASNDIIKSDIQKLIGALNDQ